jgi:cytoskeleton protein RodZ
VAPPAPAPSGAEPGRPATAAAAPAAGEQKLLLRARGGTVWIQVRERAGGPILADRVLKAGESWEVPAGRQGLVFTTGNAAATELVLGDEPPVGLGSGTPVRRNVPLDIERLRAASAAATAAQGTAAAPALAPSRSASGTPPQ